MSKALQHCGYEAEDTECGGFWMTLATPFQGAIVRAAFCHKDDTGRNWKFVCHVKNSRGVGYCIEGSFHDCGRNVAKSMLRSMALELRRAYSHRGQKIRKRAIAKAKAKAAQEGGAE